MAISPLIEKYIENSKINGKLCRWEKSTVNIFVTNITGNVENKEILYLKVRQAISVWNQNLNSCGINLVFCQIQTPIGADIIIHWTKTGRVFEGMCKYISIINGFFKKISIDIGLPNELSGKVITTESIFSTILHELGHSLGLGHGVEIDDIMFVPHQKNVQSPDENDLHVLKKIYGKI